MTLDASRLELYLAKASSLYAELIAITPLDQWRSVGNLSASQTEVISDRAYKLSRLVDAIRDIVDERLLTANVKINETSQARLFFSQIQPRQQEISDLWLAACGLGPDILDDLEFEDLGRKTSSTESNDVPEYRIESIQDLLDFSLDRSEQFLEDGGTHPDIILVNDVHSRVRRLMHAPFFRPDDWYENLQHLSPLVLNEKKLPRSLELRLRELHVSLIIGLPSAAVVLARSSLEYALINCAKARSIGASEGSSGLKRLGTLVNEYSDRMPEIEIDLRCVKQLGDRAIHANAGHKNVVTLYSCGKADAFRSWAALATVMQALYA